uniref:Reverse transcriptase domain-containing protein n=1 Tax=Tanacetum cinerariifolium TaxID=118510 RepID=A0A699HWC7_TANCI|nr:reverse transcriptase domain-containing protein [Tanacetum cinerariifolium]
MDTIHRWVIMCRWIMCWPNTDKSGGNGVYLRSKVSVHHYNEAEYEALIAGLRIVAQMGVRNVHVSVDSKLVANQVRGTYIAKEENMIKYLEKTKSLVLVEVLKQKSIQEMEVVTVLEEDGPTWMTPVMEYLKDETLSKDRKEASKLRIKARKYELLEGVLYRTSFLKPWLSQVKKFVWDNILCRFGCLGEIVSNNGKQFNENPFKDWCEKLNITQRFASVKHPQSNGLVKRVNRSFGEGINARLGEGNKNLIEELPHKSECHTHRNKIVDSVYNDEELRLNLDLLKERREHAAIHEAKAKSKMTDYYNTRVRGVTFGLGDFLYRSNEASHAVDGGNLGPRWEGPYEVTEALETERTS